MVERLQRPHYRSPIEVSRKSKHKSANEKVGEKRGTRSCVISGSKDSTTGGEEELRYRLSELEMLP